MTSTAGSDTPATPADGATAGTRPEWTGRHRAETPADSASLETDGSAPGEAAAGQVDRSEISSDSELSHAPTATQADATAHTPATGSALGEATADSEISGDGGLSRAPVGQADGSEISDASEISRASADEVTGGHEMSRASTDTETADDDAESAGRQASIRQRWAVIADLHQAGVATNDIAERVGITPGAVDLILQAHRRNRVTLRD